MEPMLRAGHAGLGARVALDVDRYRKARDVAGRYLHEEDSEARILAEGRDSSFAIFAFSRIF